jgi:hypothetical protein
MSALFPAYKEASTLHVSLREPVKLSATLKREGLQLPCTVRAVKVSIPRLEISEYVKVEIVEAPSGIPDGQYAIHFEGRRFNVNKASGNWVSGLL